MQDQIKFKILCATFVDVLRDQKGSEFATKIGTLIDGLDPIHFVVDDPDVLKATTILLQFLNSCQTASSGFAAIAKKHLLDRLANSLRENPEQFRSMACAVSIDLVFTAHPTEIRRQSVQRIDRKLLAILEEECPDEDALKREILTLWKTALSRRGVLSVSDEISNGVDVFYRSVIPSVTAVSSSLESFELNQGIQFSSWIGGDRDGNPNVDADTLHFAAVRHVDTVLAYYLSELRKLAEELSIEDDLVEVPTHLKSISQRSPARSSQFQTESLRKAIHWIIERLSNYHVKFVNNRSLENCDYPVSKLRTDLDVISDSLGRAAERNDIPS